MSLLPKLGDVRSGLNSGLKPDLQAFESFIWDTGNNIEFGGSGVRKMSGFTSPFTSIGTTPVRGMTQQLTGTGQKLFFGDQTDIYRWNTASVTAVGTGFAGNLNETVTAPASIWSMVNFGEFILATNGVDSPQIYKGTSFVALAGTPPDPVQIFAKHGPFILGFNTDVDIREFAWSDIDNPEDWVPTPSNAAGCLIIRELNSGIKCVKPIADRLAVYGTDSMALVRFLGAPLYFGYNMALNGVGAVSQESVVVVGRQHYGLTRQGFFVTDGVNQRFIDEGIIRETFMAEVNWSQASKINGFHNEEKSEVTWYYPTTTGEPTKGITYNYVNRAWSFSDQPRTSSVERIVFDNPVTAAADGKVFFNNFGVDADGLALTSLIQSKPFAGFDKDGNSLEDFFKYLDAVKLGMKTFLGTGVRVEIGTQMRLEDPVSFAEEIIIEDPSRPTYYRASARWFTLRIRSEEAGDDWELKTITFHGKTTGGYP